MRSVRGAFALLAVAGVGAGGLTGCGLGQKQAMATAITRAARATVAGEGASGSMSVLVNLVRTRVPMAPGPPRVSPGLVQAAPIILDFKTEEVAVSPPVTGDPVLLFAGTRVFQHRSTARPASTAAASNLLGLNQSPASTTTAPGNATQSLLQRARRPWLVFDFARLSNHDRTKIAGSLGLSPILVVSLLRGVLTGSVRRVGSDTLDGTPTVHYTFNAGLDKAESGVSNKAQTTVRKELRANAISGSVYKADVWIGPDGLPRRIRMRFRQSLDTATQADLTIQLDLTSYGAPAAVVLPAASQVATVSSFGTLVHSVVGA